MKHQQVVVDYSQMFKTSLACIVLVFFVWIFIKLIQSVFLLPRYLERNHERLTKTFEKRGLLNDNDDNDDEGDADADEGDDGSTECTERQDHEQPSVGANEIHSKKSD